MLPLQISYGLEVNSCNILVVDKAKLVDIWITIAIKDVKSSCTQTKYTTQFTEISCTWRPQCSEQQMVSLPETHNIVHQKQPRIQYDSMYKTTNTTASVFTLQWNTGYRLNFFLKKCTESPLDMYRTLMVIKKTLMLLKHHLFVSQKARLY